MKGTASTLSTDEKIEAVKRGEAIYFETDTVAGIGANAMDAAAVRKIFEIKKRPFDKPLAVLIADESDLGKVAKDYKGERYAKLIERFWPGALTIVFPKNPALPDVVTAGLGTVAVRLPKNDELREMLRRTGPLATSSANLSGEAPEGVPSTVGRLTASGFEILRAGAAPASEIAAALRSEKTGAEAGEGGLHGR